MYKRHTVIFVVNRRFVFKAVKAILPNTKDLVQIDTYELPADKDEFPTDKDEFQTDKDEYPADKHECPTDKDQGLFPRHISEPKRRYTCPYYTLLWPQEIEPNRTSRLPREKKK